MNKWYFLSINHLPAYRKKVLLFLFAVFIFFNISRSQVYNYDLIRYANSEVNPSYLSADESINSLSVLHHSSFAPDAPLNYSSIRYSILPKSQLSGYGVSISNTNQGKNINYASAGIGAGYRTILFNRVYFRAGAFYKANFISAPLGKFDYGIFVRDASDTVVTFNFNQSANLSFSFASNGNRAYLNCGVLNYAPIKQYSPFPVYYYMNLGDLGKLLTDRRCQFYYTVFVKKSGEVTSFSNYFTLLDKFQVTREASIHYGARFGIADNKYFHINPILNYFTKTGTGKMLVIQLLFDITFKNQNENRSFPPGGQLSLNYFFYKK